MRCSDDSLSHRFSITVVFNNDAIVMYVPHMHTLCLSYYISIMAPAGKQTLK